MELIFEVIEPSGRVHQFRKFDGVQVSIGRAYDNDLILTDPTVDPHHAVILNDENDQLILKDLGSINGSYSLPRQRIDGSVSLVTSNEYMLGKTRVYVFKPDHPVAPTLPIGNTESMLDVLGRPLVVTAALLLTLIVYAGQQWLNMFSGLKWQGIANVSLMIFGSAMAITIFWAVIGRLLKHQSNFWKQATIVLLFIVAQYLLSIIYDLILFNSLDYMFSMSIMILLECMLVAVLLWFNLYLATNQSAKQRTTSVVAIALVLILLSVYSEFLFREEFSETPEYVRLLKPPIYHLVGTVSEDEFIINAAGVFSRLDSK